PDMGWLCVFRLPDPRLALAPEMREARRQLAPIDEGGSRRPASFAHFTAQLGRQSLVHDPGTRIDHDTICGAGHFQADVLAANIPEHLPGVALQWISPPTGTCLVVPKRLALADHARDLARHELLARGAGIEEVTAKPARLRIIQAEGSKCAAVITDLQGSLILLHFVFAAE